MRKHTKQNTHKIKCTSYEHKTPQIPKFPSEQSLPAGDHNHLAWLCSALTVIPTFFEINFKIKLRDINQIFSNSFGRNRQLLFCHIRSTSTH